jgi:hypothetical protein
MVEGPNETSLFRERKVPPVILDPPTVLRIAKLQFWAYNKKSVMPAWTCKCIDSYSAAATA